MYIIYTYIYVCIYTGKQIIYMYICIYIYIYIYTHIYYICTNKIETRKTEKLQICSDSEFHV